MLLAHLLQRIVRTGTVRIIDAQGRAHVCAGAPGPTVTIRLHDPKLGHQLFLNPRLKLGEAYMAGTLTVEDATLYDFLDLVAGNIAQAPRSILSPLYDGYGKSFRVFQQYNPVKRAQANAHHHYDLSKTLYDLFLDSDRQYSCAYFTGPDQSLEEAQAQKKRHIAAKLLLKPGQRVLDIGCGWGGLALYLAKECEVVGHRRHPFDRAARSGAPPRRRGRARRARQVRADRLPHGGGAVRPDRLGRHVRACRRRALPHLLPQGARASRARRRGAPALDRPRRRAGCHQPVDPPLHLPWRLFAGLERGRRRSSRRPGSSSPTSRSCGSIMPRRSGAGAPASSPTASACASSTTSASAACGNSTSRRPRSPSATRATSCSRCSWRRRWTPCR